MTERFPEQVKSAKGSNQLDSFDQIKIYSDNSKHVPIYKELKDLMHFNQTDMVLLSPIEQYFIHRKQWPHPQYVDHYLINVWLAMQFLEGENLCSNPKLQESIYPNITRLKSIVNSKKL